MFLRAENGIALHIDASSVVWTLIYNGKLANQIVRLVASGVKNKLYHKTVCTVHQPKFQPNLPVLENEKTKAAGSPFGQKGKNSVNSSIFALRRQT